MTVDVENAVEGAGDGRDCDGCTNPPGRLDVMTCCGSRWVLVVLFFDRGEASVGTRPELMRRTKIPQL